jgi:two-component system cell cycle response regulator
MENPMNDKRTFLPLGLGAVAAILGVLGFVLDLTALGLAAGLVALGVGALVLRPAPASGTAEAEATSEAQVAELETALAAQVQARIAAEDAVRSLGEQLASAERDVANRAPVVVPAKRAESLTDEATGLFSEDYFRVAVDARIAAARRHLRPVAVVLLEVLEGLRSGTPQSAQPMLVAEMINATLREADTACRLLDGRFGLVLEDTSENGAIWTVERVRRSIAELQQGLTLRAGIACYPAHAFGSTELLQRADEALVAARDWNQDRIEVANVE